MPRDAIELACRLARDAESLCRHYLSNGHRHGLYWMVGDARNTPGRSMFVRLSGPEFGPGAAGLSANHLAAFLFPPTLHRLYIARDNDAAGDMAFAALTERAKEAGIEVFALSPRMGDFNDDLHAFDLNELQAALRTQLAPQKNFH